MKSMSPNLARRPFENKRPVVRLSALLGALGLALCAANVTVYWSFSQGQDEKRDRLEEVRAAIEKERETIGELEERRRRIDLELQNEQVAFLNHKIRERRFGWSALFDAVAEVLPRDVRIERLTPQSLAPERGSRLAASIVDSGVQIGIQAEARGHEAFLDFLDALHDSPAFANPNPSREQRQRDGLFRFTLEVTYLPHPVLAEAAPAVSGEAAPEGEGGEGSEAGGSEEPDPETTEVPEGDEDQGEDADDEQEEQEVASRALSARAAGRRS